MSEYGKQLREKQKLRHFYNLKEGKFKRYVKEALNRSGKGGDNREYFVRTLEKRLDNVIYRLGFADSRPQARQLVGHGHFKVNGRKVNIPSYEVQVGDKISLKESSTNKAGFAELQMKLKNHELPDWLRVDIENLEGEVVSDPTLEEVSFPVEISNIFEYYSR